MSWDFFGPTSEGTARHFARHLEGFLLQHELSFKATLELHEGATSVHLVVPEGELERLSGALRPRRVEALSAERAMSEQLAGQQGASESPVTPATGAEG